MVKKSEGGTKMSKKILITLLVLSLPMLALGAWLFTINVNVISETVSLGGNQPINIDLPALTVNTTEGADCNTVNDTFILNRDTVLNVSITESYQDNSGGQCNGGINDCTMEYRLENSTGVLSDLYNGQAINVEAIRGYRSIEATTCCIEYSCPQTRSVDIVLTEVGSR